MARFDYSNLQSTAQRLIDQFGQDATLIKPGIPESDATQYDDPPADSESAIVLVELEFSLLRRVSAISQGGASLVQQGDKRWLVSTSRLAPAVEDEISLGGVAYQVINSDPLSPGGTVMLYEVQARK